MQSLRNSLITSALLFTASQAYELSELSMKEIPQDHPFVGEFEGKNIAMHANGETVSARLTEHVGKTSSFKHAKVSYSPKRSVFEQLNDLIYGKSYKQELLEHYVDQAFASFDRLV